MMLIFRYLRRIFSLWTTWVFITIDIIFFLSGLAGVTPDMPALVYGYLALLGFIISNIQLYSILENQVRELSKNEADLFVKAHDSELVFLTTNQTDNNFIIGIDKQGFPIHSLIRIPMEIENLGKEEGRLSWIIDFTRSQLPPPFLFHDETENGHFRDFTGYLSGRNRAESTLYFPVRIDHALDINYFATLLQIPKEYKITIKYYTIKIGGQGDQRTVTIRGNTAKYRSDLINAWKRHDLPNLVEVIDD